MHPTAMNLVDGSRVAVIGGGPAGTFSAYFLREMAERARLELQVDLYEPKDFRRSGPAGCNYCGGIVSESLGQLLAVEGIHLPEEVVQRGIDAYVIHSGAESVRIATPLHEKRIAALHRGHGPEQGGAWGSFDGYLLGLAVHRGVRHLPQLVTGLARETDGRLRLEPRGGEPATYDLVVAAMGVNAPWAKLLTQAGLAYRAPTLAKASISELALGAERVQACLGDAMHIFLLDQPGLDFAALIPKGANVTVCLIGSAVTHELAASFLQRPEVRACLPADFQPAERACRCLPKMNLRAAEPLFADRLVLVGDCGATRLYKDGIGAAYRLAKAVAVTSVFHGVGEADFRRWYRPHCRRLRVDNSLGRGIFNVADLSRRLPVFRRGILRMARAEQRPGGPRLAMSTVLWDLFTGSAAYADVLRRALHPGFLWRLLLATAGEALHTPGSGRAPVDRPPASEASTR